ncbi:MAG: phospholipase D-like domain-containing protein [Bacteroidales bacterium]
MKSYFKDLEKEVRSRLEQATTRISVAVAWFTNPRLLDELIRLLRAGGSVEVMLVDDEINRKGLDFEEYLSLGGKLYWIDPQMHGLMHNKFCVIDASISMTGSYNWTNKASYNHENLVINDEVIDAQDYLVYFDELKHQFGLNTQRTSVSMELLLKRMRLMIETLRMGDEDDILYQSGTFESLYRQAEQIEVFDAAIACMRKGETAEAADLLEGWIRSNSQLRNPDADRMAWLRIQIELLRTEIGQIESDLMSARSLVEEFTRRLHLAVADLIMEIRHVQTLIAQKRMSRSDKAEDRAAYEHAQAEEERFSESRQRLKAEEEEHPSLNDADFDTLNKCYKKGVKHAHPDRFMDDPEKCARATELMQALNVLRKNNDLAAMQLLVEQIVSGEAFLTANQASSPALRKSTIEELEAVLEQLRQKRDAIYAELRELYLSEYYEQVVETERWQDVIEAKRESCRQMLRALRQELNRMG